MEYAIGETVTLPDGRRVRVEKGKYCRECAINALGINTCIEWTDEEKIGVCSSASRSDHKDIIYREVKDTDTNPIKERAKDAWAVYVYRDGYLYNTTFEDGYVIGATEQKVIDDKWTEELLQYLEELEAHYCDLRQYDDGKPIRRVIEYIKTLGRQV